MVIDFHCLNFQADSVHFDQYFVILLILYKTFKQAPFFDSQRKVLVSSIKKEKKVLDGGVHFVIGWTKGKNISGLKKKFEKNLIYINEI